MPIDLCDERFLEIEKREDDLLCRGDPGKEQRRIIDDLLHSCNVAAGRKRPARSRQDDDVAVGVLRSVEEHLAKLGMHLVADRVEAGWIIENDGQNTIAAREPNGLIVLFPSSAHRGFPSAPAGRSISALQTAPATSRSWRDAPPSS